MILVIRSLVERYNADKDGPVPLFDSLSRVALNKGVQTCIGNALKQLGLKITREKRLKFLSAIVGREVTSTYDLTVAEARAIVNFARTNPMQFILGAGRIFLDEGGANGFVGINSDQDNN